MPVLSCSHQESHAFRQVCSHLLEMQDAEYKRYFPGVGLTYHLVCSSCAQQTQNIASHLCTICELCFKRIEDDGYWDGIVGQPEVLHEPSELAFVHRVVSVPDLILDTLVETQALPHTTNRIWISMTATGKLLQIDLDKQKVFTLAHLLPSEIDLTQPVALCIAPDGNLVAVTNTLGRNGVVLELDSGRRTVQLQRDDYHSDVSPFPVAFFMHKDRLLLVHATAWNRLDITDPITGMLLTQREPTSYHRDEQRPQHYLDYFHGRLIVSPNHDWIADDGWIWHPVGCVTSWSIYQWVEENPWELEDGESKRSLCCRDYFWGGPFCWVDNHTLAIWGYGRDDEWLIPAVRLFDVISGDEVRWFAGPEMAPKGQTWREKLAGFKGDLIFDRYLFACSGQYGVSVWDVVKGTCLLQDDTFFPICYHQGTQEFLSLNSDGTFQLSHLTHK
jgi:hypothetical protein